ncbi:hypothetical protein Tco_0811107 [Tanacetum coccineum]
MVTESLEQSVLAKESSQPQSSCDVAVTLIEFELKKILIDKIDKSESYMAPLMEHKESMKDLIKSNDHQKRLSSPLMEPSLNQNLLEKSVQLEEPEFEVADLDMLQDQEGNLGNDDDEPMKENSKTFDEFMSTSIDFSAYIMNGLKITNLTQETLLGPTFRLLNDTHSNYAKLEYDFEECHKALLEKLDWEKPEGGDYPFDLTKPLPLVMSGNRQNVPVDYFFNNYLKYLQGGVLAMTYMTSITKTKAAQYDLPIIEDMIVERRAGNDLYIFKEGGFPCLRINDIEDMLLFVLQNWLTNLSGDDVSDFAIALRMFIRSLVIHKRVEDL